MAPVRRGDLALARLGQGHPGILPELVCFHAQQAAEKSLKAAPLATGVEPPFVHDLDFLLRALEQRSVPVPGALDEAKRLTLYGVQLRYPDHGEDITEADVAEALRLATTVLDWTRSLIGRLRAS